MTRSRRAPSSPPRTRPISSASSRPRTRRSTRPDPARLAKANLHRRHDAAAPRRSARRRWASTTRRTRSPTRRKTRDDLKTQIRLATLKAPIDGIVTAVNVSQGLDAPVGRRDRRRRRPRSRSPPTWSRATSPPSKVGQPATVTIAAVDATVTGTVTAIAPTAAGTTTRQRRLLRGDRRARRTCPRRVRAGMTRGRHDHDRQRDERADRPGRGAARDDRQLLAS